MLEDDKKRKKRERDRQIRKKNLTQITKREEEKSLISRTRKKLKMHLRERATSNQEERKIEKDRYQANDPRKEPKPTLRP